ncbi:hypothetical protein EWM64_g2817 [Hericium alpestre]|uniref:Peptidase A1 domain-containing protein n=1 Tax=Hericium alpestre TaxID=135208 RepID=A0A4Z0A2D1_9AGAM|nr:hypothetical protein EWM64_g2817 [Hericium alpestre]
MYFSPAFVLAALPFLAAATPLAMPVPRAEQIIPLTKRNSFRREDGSINATKLQSNINYAVAKIQRGFENYEKNTGAAHPLAASLKHKKRATGADALTDDEAQLWYGSISVGTPAKKYTVDFDTGSSDLFLPGPSCSENCEGHTTYNPSSSSTSKSLGKSFSLSYGDGSTVSGTQYTDTVSIAGLTVLADGAGKDLELVFGFKFAESGSELYLGGTNSDLYSGDFTWVPVTQAAYWQVELGGLSVNGKSALSRMAAIVDTGTTQLIGDPDTVKSIYSQISGAKSASQYGDGIYTIPCDFSTPISLTFSGKTFDVDPKNFNIGSVGSNACIGGLASDAQISEEFWIVGDVFLTSIYTAFDVGNNQVGFPTLKVRDIPATFTLFTLWLGHSL